MDIDPTAGLRLASVRRRRGMTQEALAAVAEVSPTTITAIETGRRALTMRMALRLAPILHITDLGELFGPAVQFGLDPQSPGRHPAIEGIRRALTDWHVPDDGGGGRLESGQYLHGAVDAAWRTWHSSPSQRSEIGVILPGLLAAARRAARAAEGQDRALVLAMLAQAYHLAQTCMAWNAERELVYLAVDRGRLAADESQDPIAVGMSVWYSSAALRAVGRSDEALDDLAAARALLARADVQAPAYGRAGQVREERAAVIADLWLRSALTRARAGDRGAAADFEQGAAIVYRDLPADYVNPWTKLSRVILGVKRVMIAVELGDTDEVRSVASGLDPADIPSVERRARHLIEVARGLHQEGSPEAVLLVLTQAAAISAQTVAYTPAGRDLVGKLVSSVGATSRQQVLDLAARVGIET